MAGKDGLRRRTPGKLRTVAAAAGHAHGKRTLHKGTADYKKILLAGSHRTPSARAVHLQLFLDRLNTWKERRRPGQTR